jgi:hypothetical protein
MPKVDELLKEPGRNWTPAPPAGEEDILRLVQFFKVRLPAEYLDLLRFSNGGSGTLALPPLRLDLFSIDEVIEKSADEFYGDEFPDFIFLGGNGGLELIAFDLSRGEPRPVVMVDPIAGAESAVEIAPSMAQLIEAMGLECAET